MTVYHADYGRLQPAAEPERALAVNEAIAARFLSISPRTLWQLRRDGRGPAHAMIGSSVRYAVAELHRWLAEQQAAVATKQEGGAA